jgi:hypothetical protein
MGKWEKNAISFRFLLSSPPLSPYNGRPFSGTSGYLDPGPITHHIFWGRPGPYSPESVLLFVEFSDFEFFVKSFHIPVIKFFVLPEQLDCMQGLLNIPSHK